MPSKPSATDSQVGVAIVTYNSAHVLVDCLKTLKSYSLPVLVVDNGSSDGTCFIARQFDVTLLDNAANRGFAAAANQGIAALDTPFVLLLNPDVVLTRSPEFLLDEFAKENVAVAAATLLQLDGLPQHEFQFRRYPTPFTLLFETLGLNRVWPANSVNRRYRYANHDWTEPCDIDQPAGAFMLIRRAAWASIGGFDEQFWPLWFEDVDFCLQLSRNGYVSRYVPTVGGIHLGGHSIHHLEPSRRQLYWYRSLLQYTAKHFSAFWVRMIALSVLLNLAGKASLMITPTRKRRSIHQIKPTAMLGLRTFFLGRPPSTGPDPLVCGNGHET